MDGENVLDILSRWKSISRFERVPCSPTKAIPGSRAKVEVLRKRNEAGEELWHESDPYCYKGGTGARSRAPTGRILNQLSAGSELGGAFAAGSASELETDITDDFIRRSMRRCIADEPAVEYESIEDDD
jgi:hypothetical protein